MDEIQGKTHGDSSVASAMVEFGRRWRNAEALCWISPTLRAGLKSAAASAAEKKRVNHQRMSDTQ